MSGIVHTRGESLWDGLVKIKECGLSFFFIFFLILFFFQFIFYFSIFKTLGLGLEVIGHTVTSDRCGHSMDHETQEKK